MSKFSWEKNLFSTYTVILQSLFSHTRDLGFLIFICFLIVPCVFSLFFHLWALCLCFHRPINTTLYSVLQLVITISNAPSFSCMTLDSLALNYLWHVIAQKLSTPKPFCTFSQWSFVLTAKWTLPKLILYPQQLCNFIFAPWLSATVLWICWML